MFNGAKSFTLRTDGTVVIEYADGSQKRYNAVEAASHPTAPANYIQAVRSYQEERKTEPDGNRGTGQPSEGI